MGRWLKEKCPNAEYDFCVKKENSERERERERERTQIHS
jgi:hypothetical protein